MYIKSMVIDGFKSYAQRTEISGFDCMFNAITGLNGSGKSNILDAICFLLGITNLSQVRATNLQELVYKNGQAGVTKATVSVVFDNSDKKQSPLGYEQYDEITVTRQVVIGGRNKYLINGSNANNTRVQDLFRSVQLNVNNPHFLIMQGRITKVLNMKPPEILSMIEEAAGTKLYESKRESAQKTIEKKDAKLHEIETILTEEINPTLLRLKEERSSYLEYQKVIRELEHLNKLYIAYRFVCAEDSKHKAAEDLDAMQASMKKLTDRQKEIEVQVTQLEKSIHELEKKRDEEAGGVMKHLETVLHDRQKEDAKAQSNASHKKEALKAEQKKLREINKNCTSDQVAIDNKKKELSKLDKELAKLGEKSTHDQQAQTDAQNHYHAVSAGLSSNQDGEDATLNDQLMSAKNDISNADTETKQAEMRLKHARSEVKKKQSELKNSEKGYNKDKTVFDVAQREMDKISAEMNKLNYEEGKQESLSEQRRRLSGEVQHLREKVETMEARFPQLQFQYRDPEKNFDRSKVHGLIAKLVQVKDAKAATALEVAAGGKLYNVVVDTEQTGKKLLQKGELRRRYTIIPLNKISARAIDQNVVRKAENLVGKKNVSTALSLVGYEDELVKAMEFVFGNAFVCADMDTAKQVTFNEAVMKKSVTLEGDSFDPAGTLTGGARNNVGNMLSKLGELREAEQNLHVKEQQLHEVEGELSGIVRVATRYGELKQKCELKQREAQLVGEKLKQSTHGQQLEEIQALQESIDDSEKILADAKETKAKATKKVKDLEDKVKNAKAIRERELKEAEQNVTKAKKALDESKKKTKEKEQEVESVRLELEELSREVNNYEEQIKATEDAIQGFEEQVAQLQDTANVSKDAVKQAQTALNEQKDRLKACNKDIEERLTEHKSLQKEGNAAELQLQELGHKISKTNKDAKDAVRTVEEYLKTHEWIGTEKKYFGQANTAYDFEANDPKEAGRRIQKLQDTKDNLSKKVNMRAMNMLGKAEEQYSDLMKKRQIVLNDKGKIAAVIKELDEKKNMALRKAHTQVNKDFGSIFSTLLPGTQAKLIAPDGRSILDGLEVKVAFGDIWKESLQELSGGQRSLVALSLILSLLLFKPAPLYILDEVDAALDLSHTQNIGQMLRTHFRHSQFIVVSLKDGMFNNANVLYKTKFVDGVSTVTRYAQVPSSRTAPTKTFNNITGGKKAKKPRLNTDGTNDTENVV